VPIRLTEDEFARLVDEAIESLPQQFAARLQNVAVNVQPIPDAGQVQRLNLRRPSGLLGLYEGVPLTKKTVGAMLDWPEQIIIFQRNIENLCRNRRQVLDCVRRTVLHEIGHHFGLDEKDLRDLGYG